MLTRGQSDDTGFAEEPWIEVLRSVDQTYKQRVDHQAQLEQRNAELEAIRTSRPSWARGRRRGVERASSRPRGSLGHWFVVREGRIARYQIIAPTTWSFSPRDAHGVPGPVEQALVGAPVRP